MKPEAKGIDAKHVTHPGSEYQIKTDLTGDEGLEVKEASGGKFYEYTCNKKCQEKCTCGPNCDCTNSDCKCKCSFVQK